MPIVIVRGYFNVSVMFPSIYFTYPIVFVLIIGLFSMYKGFILKFLWLLLEKNHIGQIFHAHVTTITSIPLKPYFKGFC